MYNDSFQLGAVCYNYEHSLKSTHGCPQPLNHAVSNINSAVAYTASGLDPYTHYIVKVVAITGNGEGHPVNTTVRTDEEGTFLKIQRLYSF